MNPIITVTRNIAGAQHLDKQTNGTMRADNGDKKLQIYTLERPWLNNAQGVSSIPAGVYQVKKVPASHIPYPHFAIQNVPNRSGVCIHIANYVNQLEGCIAVGMALKDVNADGLLDTVSSKQAFDLLFDLMPDECELNIIEA